MQVIASQHIVAYASCPKQLQLNWSLYGTNQPTSTEYIVGSTIQTSYLYHAKWNRWPAWKTVILWAERFTAEFSEHVEPDYKQTKSYLVRISDWYNKCSEDYLIPGLVNVPVSLEVGSKLLFRDHIPLVLIGERFILADFYQQNNIKDYDSFKLSNDFQVLTKIWGFWKFTRSIPEKFVRFIVSPNSIQPVQIFITEKRLLYVERMIKHIIKGINSSIFYPAISEKCYTCTCKEKCFL